MGDEVKQALVQDHAELYDPQVARRYFTKFEKIGGYLGKVAAEMEAAHPLLRYRVQGGSAALFDGEPPASVAALGRRLRPSLVDLFVALTRAPESHRTQF